MDSKVRESGLKRKLETYIPFSVQKLLYNAIKKLRLAKNTAKNKYTKDGIKRLLLNAGLQKGDVVILHSSLGRIGYVENGPDTVIDAFLEIIGDEGTFVVPTHSNPEYDEKQKMFRV